MKMIASTAYYYYLHLLYSRKESLFSPFSHVNAWNTDDDDDDDDDVDDSLSRAQGKIGSGRQTLGDARGNPG